MGEQSGEVRTVRVGDLPVGGDHPVVVQSMTSTPTADVQATVDQIHRLREAGCELVRVAVPDREAAGRLGEIKSRIEIPLVADIHFDHQLALLAVEEGVDKIRINPGNIKDEEKIKAIVEACREAQVAIRIGVNSGSLDSEKREKYGGLTPRALVESALEYIELFEKLDFYRTIVSLKSSSVPLTVRSCRRFAARSDYPLHLGVTEAGSYPRGAIKSAAGLGGLLVEGIGSTVRISLTGDPVREIEVAYQLLQDTQRRLTGPELITCPTCARTHVDLEKIAREVETELKKIDFPIRVAVMGCEVNGPGEAREADVGIACSPGGGLLFKDGEILRRVSEDEMVARLMAEIKNY
ncbi:MAG: flavodoxin-dependent (E)-4-hydroxy-3-methylbut-2-enyl-diphosphate synthase [bacterium]